MTFSTPELTLDQVLETAKKYGYAGIEPRLDSGHKHGIEVATSASDRGALREQAEVSGIALACIATSLTYADPAKTDDMIAQTHERIDLAGDVGAPAMRVFGGRIPDGIEREAAIGIVADSLGSVADHAGERGVTICMETHDDWCAPAHVAEVLSRVNHAHIAANWDIMHPVRRADTTIDASFETLKPWIRHLHVHDGMKEAACCPLATASSITAAPLSCCCPSTTKASSAANGSIGSPATSTSRASWRR